LNNSLHNGLIKTPEGCQTECIDKDIPSMHHATAAPTANKKQLPSPKDQQIFYFVGLIADRQMQKL